jgi:hypothetical protein
MSNVKHYYAGGNTCLGFYSLYEEVFRGLDRLYILKGGPGTGKSTFMRKIGEVLSDQGLDVEYYHCSSDNESIDGVIASAIKLGFVDGTAPHIVDPKYPGVTEHIINLGEFWDEDYLAQFKDRIIELTDKISEQFEACYNKFALAKHIHDEWEDIYLAAMDFEKANVVTDNLISAIFGGEIEREENPSVKQRFFGAATPKGAVNYYENITEDLKKRYIVKGRPGSGKSTMMKRIGKRAEKLGLSVEYYPCGLDPNSMDMVLIPKLGVAVFDGTAPHVVNPSRDTDQVVDMFELCIDTKVEEKKAKELEEVVARYSKEMKAGTEHLEEAKRLHDELEKYYVAAMDFEALGKKREQILKEVLQFIEEKNSVRS